MSKRYMERATREGRVALLPEFLQEGREVWYWAENDCEEDGCGDCMGLSCPLSAGFQWFEDEPRRCARQHPVLEHDVVWSVTAAFDWKGVEWSVNSLPPVPDALLRQSFFPTKAAALRSRPEEVV